MRGDVSSSRRTSVVELGVRLALALGAALIASLSARVYAYRTLADDPQVQQPASQSGGALRWNVAAAGLTPVELGDVLAASGAAIAVWTAPECTSLRSTREEGVTPEHAVHGDGISTVEVVRTGWGSRGLEVGRGATTDLQVVVGDEGVAWIREADIYLDYEHYMWSSSGNAASLDVQAVLTHEFGHALGLLHPCGDAGAPPCSFAAGESAMFPEYRRDRGRALSDDDVAAVCALYPTMLCVPVCQAGESCVDGQCVASCDGATACGTCGAGGCVGNSCEADAECGGAQCAQYGPSEAVCVAAGSFGTACNSANDCASRLCFASSGGSSFCTRGCQAATECSAYGLDCRAVGGVRVCATPLVAAQGCAVRAGRPRSRAWLIGCVMFCVALLGRRLGYRS